MDPLTRPYSGLSIYVAQAYYCDRKLKVKSTTELLHLYLGDGAASNKYFAPQLR